MTGYCKNYHKAGGLKQQNINYLTVLEANSLNWVSLGPNQGVGQARLLPDALAEHLFLAASSFLRLPASLGQCSHHSNLCLYTILLFCLCLISLHLLLTRRWVIALGPHFSITSIIIIIIIIISAIESDTGSRIRTWNIACMVPERSLFSLQKPLLHRTGSVS